MRAPWMSRETYERSVALLTAQLQRAESLYAAERATVRDLTDTITSMKRQGYNPPDAITVPQQIPLNLVDAALRTHVPLRLRSQVMGQVALWRSHGLTDAQIAKRIEVGEEAWPDVKASA